LDRLGGQGFGPVEWLSLAERPHTIRGKFNRLHASYRRTLQKDGCHQERSDGHDLEIFDARRAAGIKRGVRVEAAEALGQAGDPRLTADNWVTIPTGRFLMGAQNTRKNKPGYDPEADHDESVREVSFAKPFRIGRYPVTVEEYKHFVEDKVNGPESAPRDWDEQVLHPNRPVVGANWFEAAAYCSWAGGRLPTEEEREFAARGKEACRYPWGNEPPDASRANYSESGTNMPTPIGLFPAGNTSEGVADMAGNVWEWTGSEYVKDSKVVRGASFSYEAWRLRSAFRSGFRPWGRSGDLGFRCVRDI
jgi:formylglycine-generating enzyme required for sulfatase activity